MLNRLFVFTTLFIISFCFACNNDEEEMDDMMMPPSVDITAQLVGSFKGTNEFGEGGSFITEDDRTTTISRLADSLINVRTSTLFGDNSVFEAKLSSETEFSADDVSVLGDSGYSGNGRLSGDTLFIDLNLGNKYYEFVGVRQ